MRTDTLPVMGRPKKSEPTEPLRLPASAVQKIRQLAVRARMDPGDWFVAEFGAMLDRKHFKMLEEQIREAQSRKD